MPTGGARRTELESLSLASTRIADSDLELIGHFTRLRFLDLDGTPISDQGVAHLDALNALVVLSLSNTHVSDGGAKVIPNCLRCNIWNLTIQK